MTYLSNLWAAFRCLLAAEVLQLAFWLLPEQPHIPEHLDARLSVVHALLKITRGPLELHIAAARANIKKTPVA